MRRMISNARDGMGQGTATAVPRTQSHYRISGLAVASPQRSGDRLSIEPVAKDRDALVDPAFPVKGDLVLCVFVGRRKT